MFACGNAVFFILCCCYCSGEWEKCFVLLLSALSRLFVWLLVETRFFLFCVVVIVRVNGRNALFCCCRHCLDELNGV